MAHQTQMNVNGTDNDAARDVARSAFSLWHHLLTLAELQLQVIQIELKSGISRAEKSFCLLVVGGIVAISSLPLLLVTFALILMQTLAFTAASAFAAVSVCAMVGALALLIIGWKGFSRHFPDFSRSRLEWKMNWEWVKERSRLGHLPTSQKSPTTNSNRFTGEI